MEYKERRCPRLNCYDYSSPGVYFITVCTYKMRTLFWKNPMCLDSTPIEDKLNFAGKIADETIGSIQKIFQVKVDKYVIMPNHIHMILLIENDSEMGAKTGLISRVVGCFKAIISKRLHEFNVNDIIWQRSFYDHIIRNEKDYQRIWNYIENNPNEWEKDRFFEKYEEPRNCTF